ncbi:hypothetical protein EGK29_19875 [Klebsiella pneumoniae]|nr:hypothetical protein EGK29_19875 [Klebsiella pneumoniae]
MLPPAGWAESSFDSSKARSFCPGTNEKLTVRQELTEKRRGVRLAGMVSESESTETKKTTRRWFHDTAYCFDYSVFPNGTRSGT